MWLTVTATKNIFPPGLPNLIVVLHHLGLNMFTQRYTVHFAISVKFSSISRNGKELTLHDVDPLLDTNILYLNHIIQDVL